MRVRSAAASDSQPRWMARPPAKGRFSRFYEVGDVPATNHHVGWVSVRHCGGARVAQLSMAPAVPSKTGFNDRRARSASATAVQSPLQRGFERSCGTSIGTRTTCSKTREN